ncbi:TPA: hypothetical protein JBH59_11055 [Legionella pneumophila]|nr:hypothetical protein D7226_01815 [Legionella pneumophila]HAT8945286.1 hypothetical protein [Legionella pneumophila subsp. pneumophila]RYX35245.1 hypothetical protein D7271_04185 [Legionella pneumophila]RYX39597.1 hypothetical protein D7275_12830 [Legionella pneumophila]RYX49912.1 hypothetical protein D7272_12040 [Legionella pneumophila]
MEKCSDKLISTLSKYSSVMGGSLKLMAEFPDRAAPIEIHGIFEISIHCNSKVIQAFPLHSSAYRRC